MNTPRTIEQRREVIRRYLERRQLYPLAPATEHDHEPGLIVVVPCYDEPDIQPLLESLVRCQFAGVAVQALMVVNAPSGAPAGALRNNRAAAGAVAVYAERHAPDWLTLDALRVEELPAAKAGVGLARKIGMDEAARRLSETAAGDGVIASLDADCRVEPNYFAALLAAFEAHPGCPGAAVHFEHDVPTDARLARAICEYELHLRYYVAGQRRAEFPYAFHTIGSAQACRAASYAAQGGMNLRRGGEDFYFAQKLIALGGYRSITSTCVHPAARVSHRVPFGTGPALARVVAGEPLLTFAPEIFADLGKICATLSRARPDDLAEALPAVSPRVARFLREQHFDTALAEARANTASAAALRKRLFRWFNAFRFLRFAQHASRNGCPKLPVVAAAAALLADCAEPAPNDAQALLWVYRDADRAAPGIDQRFEPVRISG